MYVKLFESLIGSTLWHEDSDTRIVWITMLMKADADGFVNYTAPGISDISRVPLDVTERAIQKFMEADPHSRTQAHEGRRIERVEGGFVILNYRHYRAIQTESDRREKTRKRVARYRARRRAETAASEGCNAPCNAPVTLSNAGNAIQKESTEVDTETEVRRAVVACSKVQDPPPDLPRLSLPKRVGGFLCRSGNEQQRQDFDALLAEMLTITDARTVKKSLTELNGALADREPTNLAAYSRPIFERNLKNWQRSRREEQKLKGEDAQMRALWAEEDKRAVERLKQRLGVAEGVEGEAKT